MRVSTARVFSLRFALIVWLTVASHAATFKNPILINTPYDPVGLASADFNGDGKLDLVYIDGYSNHALHVLLGKGDGTFSHGQDMELPAGLCGFNDCVINVADVTNDGILDLVVGGSGTSTAQVGAFRGNGDGTFQQAVVSTMIANTIGNFPSLGGRIGIGDIDGDGAVDLVVGDLANNVIWVAQGDNTGKFTFLNTLGSGYPIAAYLMDLNGDGHLDIVTLDRLGASAQVNLGNGDGTFQTGVDYSFGTATYSLYLFDLDGDGHPDVVGETYPSQVAMMKGNPDGTFGAATTLTTVPTDAILAGFGDYNGSGTTDLVFLNSAGIGVVPGSGNLTYGSLLSSLAGASSSMLLAQGDFNRDGRTDVALGVEGGIALLLGKGDGTFLSADVYDVGKSVGTAVVADFNGDKLADIAVTVPADYPRLLLGNGLGQFTLASDQNTSYGTQSPGSAAAVADFNGDGKKDLVVIEVSSANPYGGPVVLFGQGDGTFLAPTSLTNGSTVVGDLNSDGKSDMVSATFPGPPYIVSTLGAANDTFNAMNTLLRNPTFAGIAGLGDLNHDGKPDLLVYAYTALEVWFGNGDGTFSYQGRIDFNGYVAQQMVPIADLDGDGKADLVVVQPPTLLVPTSSILIFYGNGDGTFQPPVTLATSHTYTQIVVADVNRDNKLDLVLTDGIGIAVITNLGGRTFGPEEHYVAGQSISQLNVIDVNGDGFPDIVTTSGGTIVSVLLNQPNGTPPDGTSTTGVLSVSPEPSNYDQPTSLSITLSGSASVPTGSVSFSVDGVFLANVTLSVGKATYTPSVVLTPGGHTFVSAYGGDNTYQSQSFAALHNVLPPVYTTQTTLVATPTTLFTSQTVRLTATVTSSQAVTGFVTFVDGSNTLGSQVVDQNGVARLDTSLLAAGTHQITATYQGATGSQEILAPSTSAAIAVTVKSNKSTTALSASATSVTAGTVVTFTATVTSGAGSTFGAVTFYDGTSALGTTTLLSSGTTTFSTASLGVGTHSITAAFSANATFAASTSSPLTVGVTAAAADAVPTVISISFDMTKGDSLFTAKVWAPIGSPSGQVTFLDSGSVLGTSAADPSGHATLILGMLAGGSHDLSASFEGAGFAPAVSPDLREQWPASGSGFSMSFGADSLAVTESGSSAVPFTILPLPGFQQSVELSCQSGVPSGYACMFSPASLNGGGTGLLTLQKSSNKTSFVPPTRLWFGGTMCFLAVCLVQVSGRGRTRSAAVALVILSFALLCGCGTVHPHDSNMQVLSVQATSGPGSGMIIHSAQVRLALMQPSPQAPYKAKR
jgi:hypothetical protein